MAKYQDSTQFGLWVYFTSDGDGGLHSAMQPYVAGQDLHFQWTPTAAGNVSINVMGYDATGTNDTGEGPLNISVVQTAPAGATCTPPTTGTGSTSGP